jgi:hypothetical protein
MTATVTRKSWLVSIVRLIAVAIAIICNGATEAEITLESGEPLDIDGDAVVSQFREAIRHEEYVQRFRYQTIPMDIEIATNFHTLAIDDKLPFLMDEHDIHQLVDEFTALAFRLGNPEERYHIRFADIEAAFEEFQDPETIDLFWKNCDADADWQLTIKEYVICRGDFDNAGNAFYVNEYDEREESFLYEFNMKLHKSEELPFFEYDEEGIIID